MTTIANRIKYCRLSKGFSQQFMADRLNISQSAYAKIENGITRLDVERLKEICSILEITPDQLLKMIENGNLEGMPGSSLPERNDRGIRDAYAETIRNLKEEIAFLRKLLMKEKDL